MFYLQSVSKVFFFVFFYSYLHLYVLYMYSPTGSEKEMISSISETKPVSVSVLVAGNVTFRGSGDMLGIVSRGRPIFRNIEFLMD